MNGLFSGLSLLQFRIDPNLFREEDPTNTIIGLIICGAVLFILILIGAIRQKVISRSIERGRPVGSANRRGVAGYFKIRKIASSYGLNKDHTRILANIFKNEGVRDPERIFQNPASLDRIFRNAYRTIERNSRTDEAAQRLLIQLFALRNIIESAPGPGSASSNRIAANTPAILVIGRDNYPVKIISSESHTITTDVPRNALGTPIRLTRGTAVSISFFTQSSKGYSLEGRITGSTNSSKGPALELVHTGKAKSLVKRNYRRKQQNIECEYYNVALEVTGSGRNRTSRLITGNKMMTGTILDISAGGCSMKTTSPLSAGSRLKITIYVNKNAISVLGLVLRTNRSAGIGTVLHIKFLKVPRKAYNSISALVFGYD